MLYPYQRTGAAWLAERHRALLADEMGLGKSAQAIAAADAVGAKCVVVICPASLTLNWRREFARFSSVERQLLVFSYAALTEDRVDVICGLAPDLLILDEAHFLKTRSAKRTQAVLGPKCDGTGGLVGAATRTWALTGTPTPNGPHELWPLARALGFVDLGWTKFIQRYCKMRDNGFAQIIVGGKNHAELKQRLSPHVLRRKKEEVLTELPPITFDTLPVEADYSPMREDKLLRDALDRNGLAGLKDVAAHVATWRRLCGVAKAIPCAQWTADWLNGCDRKIVLFCHHAGVAMELAMRLVDFHPVIVTGQTTQAIRDLAVRRFQHDPRFRVFIGQIQAAGTGLTLTAASDLLFVESSWVPAENEQAAARIHRIGAKEPCTVRFATLAGSIDEDITRAVMRKTADISKLWENEDV